MFFMEHSVECIIMEDLMDVGESALNKCLKIEKHAQNTMVSRSQLINYHIWAIIFSLLNMSSLFLLLLNAVESDGRNFW